MTALVYVFNRQYAEGSKNAIVHVKTKKPYYMNFLGALRVLAVQHIHKIGLCTVTSLVPSGKVASICTSGISSGTPSITSSRLSSVVP